jgi:hypothetical protein
LIHFANLCTLLLGRALATCAVVVVDTANGYFWAMGQSADEQADEAHEKKPQFRSK